MLLLMAYAAQFIPPDTFWIISFFGLAFPYIVFLNIGLVFFWAFSGSRKFLIPLIFLCLGYSPIFNTFQLWPANSSVTNGTKILSYNVHGFSADLNSKKGNASGILGYLSGVKADVLCIQEARLMKEGRLSPKSIRDALPGIKYYQLASMGSYSGSITFSRYPIVNLGEIRFPGSSNLVLFSDIKIGKSKIVRVYNCHFQSYSIDPKRYKIMESPGHGDEGEQMDEAKKISFKLKKGFQMRALQARIVSEHIQKSPYPVVVCGDFNDTPVSYAYHKVRGDLNDAFVDSGWGISSTYNGKFPFLRIDYILFNPQYVSANYQCDKVSFSDHFPIHCEIKIE